MNYIIVFNVWKDSVELNCPLGLKIHKQIVTRSIQI